MAVGRKTPVGVVDAQLQTELRARRKHPIRLVRALADQIVDENRGVAFSAIEDDGLVGVDPLEQDRRLGVADGVAGGRVLEPGGRHDLARDALLQALSLVRMDVKQPRDLLGFKAAFELRGIDGVVLDRISRAQHLRRFQSGNRLDHRQLHINRH